MKENCVYILVVDSRHEQAPDEWLYQIDELAGGNAKVILVTNWFDEVHREQNKTSLLRRFGHLIVDGGFFNFSCQKRGEAFDVFIRKLVETALESRMKILPAVLSGMEILDEYFKGRNWIRKSDLNRKLISKVEKLKAGDVLAGLNILGRIVPLQSSQLCLKPEWIIGKSYDLISSIKVMAHQGVVDEPLVWEVLGNEPESTDDGELSSQVLGFLTDHELAISICEKDASFESYFLPDAATADEPDEVKDKLNQAHLTFAYEMHHVPVKLKAQAVTHLRQSDVVRLNLPNDVWRDGVIVRSQTSDDLIIMEYQYRRQRIELNLVGKPDGDLPKLLAEIDKVLADISGRQLIGHMRLDKSGSDMPCSTFLNRQTIKVDNSVQQEMVDMLAEAIKESGPDLVIKQESNMNSNSGNTITNSTAAIGDNAKATSIHSHNVTKSLDSDQRDALLKAIDELIQKVVANGMDSEKLGLLADAKTVVEKDVTPKNEETGSFLEKMYHAITKVDQFASVAERANKYLGAALKVGMQQLGLPV